VIFITAHDDPALRAKALAVGAVACFDKPVRKETLLAALCKVVGNSNPAVSRT
jgi:CheY-like chemotaxis protein